VIGFAALGLGKSRCAPNRFSLFDLDEILQRLLQGSFSAWSASLPWDWVMSLRSTPL